MDLDVQLIHLRRTRESAASALIDSMNGDPGGRIEEADLSVAFDVLCESERVGKMAEGWVF